MSGDRNIPVWVNPLTFFEADEVLSKTMGDIQKWYGSRDGYNLRV